MPINNESLGQQFTVGSVQFSTDVDSRINIIKRREEIVYRSSVPASASNVAFVSGTEITSENNLSVADRSTSLPANRATSSDVTTIVASKNFNINTENFVVTDVFAIATNTITPIPLFFKHTLDDTLVPRDANEDLATGVTLLEVSILDSNFAAVKVADLSVDRTKGVVYSNLETSYTGTSDFLVYYVKYVVNDNGITTTHVSVLNNEPVYRLAEFDDLTPGLTIIEDGRKVYLIEETVSGFLVTLPIHATYSYKSVASSRIEILKPVSRNATESWFARVTNGLFFTQVGATLTKYYISEFLTQTFDPEPPIKRVVTEESTILSKILIKLDQENIRQDDTLLLFINIQLDDVNGNGVAAFTTNSSIVDTVAPNGQVWTQWNNTTRLGIRSVDHDTGFVDIEGLQMKTNWTATSAYYYNEENYEFTLINLNPIANREALNTRTSLFIDPDTAAETKSQTLFYLKIDDTGQVVESNWPDFDNSAMEYTPSGTTLYYEAFPSFLPSGVHTNFVDVFTVEGTAGGDFLILGDITTAEASRVDGLSTFDSRRRGGGVIDTEFAGYLATNPEAQWYWDEGYWDGIPYPGNASYYVEVPADILDGAGGVFQQNEVKDIINRHTAEGVYAVSKAYGIDVSVSGIYPSGSAVTLEWTSNEY